MKTATSSRPEDPTVKVASAATRLAGYRLRKKHKASAGSIVHYAFGAVFGALCGATAEIAARAKTALGLPCGAAVRLGAHVIAMPALGLAQSPVRQPLGKEAEEFGHRARPEAAAPLAGQGRDSLQPEDVHVDTG